MVLTFLSRPRAAAGGSGVPSVLLLVVRLSLLAFVVGFTARSQGPAAGLTLLAGAILTRGVLSRRRSVPS